MRWLAILRRLAPPHAGVVLAQVADVLESFVRDWRLSLVFGERVRLGWSGPAPAYGTCIDIGRLFDYCGKVVERIGAPAYGVCRNIEGLRMDAKLAVAALGALAQDTRLQVFRILVERGPEGLPAGVIADRLGVPPSSLTFHLQQLLHAGLVTQRRMSRQLIYAADHTTMNGLVAYLTENCCGQGVCAPACNPATVPAAVSKATAA